jgi:hypothetical protein
MPRVPPGPSSLTTDIQAARAAYRGRAPVTSEGGFVKKRPMKLSTLFFVLAAVLFVLAAVAGLATPALLAFLLSTNRVPAPLLGILQQYQVLSGALIALFAASLASIGVALTMWNQRIIAAQQLDAQHQQDALALTITRQQIASAFIGEIEVILDELQHPGVKPVLVAAKTTIESDVGTVLVGTVRIDTHFGKYFDGNPGNVGIFPSRISEGLTRFYTTLETIRMGAGWYSRAVDLHTTEGKLLMTPQQMFALLTEIINRIDFCLQSGPIILQQLREIRDARSA